MSKNIRAVSALLKGKAAFSARPYQEILSQARPGDLVYMNPPYQGVCGDKDNRCQAAISREGFCEALEALNRKGP